MPRPLAICLEHLDARAPAERYLRCTAVGGREPGLRVGRAGTVLWCSDEDVACELWISQDEKLILYRPEGAAPVTMWRAGRALEVPEGKPVVLLDRDEFAAGGRRLRLHVHGTAPAVHAPSWLPPAEPEAPRRAGRAAAAAVALGVALAGGVEVRCHPPKPDPTPPVPEWTEPDAGAPPEPPVEAAEDAATIPEIEVRVAPPSVAAPMEPPPPPPPPVEVRENPPGAPAGTALPAEGRKLDRTDRGER